MIDKQPGTNLEHAVYAAETEVNAQRVQAETLDAVRTRRNATKRYVLIALAVVCGAALYLQSSRFAEPYAWPDPAKDSSVTEADIEIIATLVETYRVSQGKYPASLDEIHLPEGLADLVTRGNVRYQTTANAFRLDWTLPQWRVEYDGEARTVKTVRSDK